MYRNKTIAINTLIIYIRMAIVILISLFSTRYVLIILGVSDYGLYNVVGSLIAMLNVISTGMYTTTRRFINVEMGKQNCDLNKVFNVCLSLHVAFAFVIFVIAETLGMFYIYNYLNVNPNKLQDAIFVFQISTITSIIGLINVPYQGLLAAFEKFNNIAIIDVCGSILKIPMIFVLLVYNGNHLRLYAIIICMISLFTCAMYHMSCYTNFKNIINLKIYKDFKMYKKILFFNNYTALGAFAYIGRTEGSSIIINMFFGTCVNGVFAIAYQIENQLLQFISNLGTASTPQIISSFSSKDYNRCYELVSSISKYSMLIMVILIFTFYQNIDYILRLWLGTVPEHAAYLCKWILLSLFIRSMAAGISPLIQASGKVKWFQITESLFMLISLPLSYLLYHYENYIETIIILCCLADLITKVIHFFLLYKIVHFDVCNFLKLVYIPIGKVMISLLIFILFFHCLGLKQMNILLIFLSFAFVLFSVYLLGLTNKERFYIKNKFSNILIRK